MHTIGIDFGTSKTLVSRIVTSTGRPETVRLGHGTDNIPTSVFIMDNGEMLFGNEADDRLTDPDGVYLRGFKMQLGSSTPVYARTNEDGELIPYMASELVALYLAHIRTCVQNTVFAGEPITRVIITRPVEFSPARCEELKQAAITAGFEEVELTTEPEAAGLAFCRLNDANTFHHSALIVDWGGGTLDCALVTREGDNIITHPNYTAGDTTIGGERFDDFLWNHANTILQEQGFTEVNPTAMLPVVRKNKEKLSYYKKTSMRLSHEYGVCPPIEVTQDLFNSLIHDSVKCAADKIMQLMARIPAADKPEILLLVGGSCRIPYIKAMLEKACKLPAVSWHLSREAVSLGAALWNTQNTLPSATATTTKSANTKSRKVKASNNTKPTTTDASNSSSRNTINVVSSIRKSSLLSLAKFGIVITLAAFGLYICTQDKHDRSPDKPVILSKEEAREYLKSIGIYEKDYPGQLLSSINANHIELLKLLITAGADVDSTDKNGWTPLLSAAYNGNSDCVEQLLKAGADVNKSNSKKTPLILAAEYGHCDCVEQLLKAGADVNKANSKKQTPLILAAEYGHCDCVEQLLKAGAEKNASDEYNKTALYWAAANGHSDCVKLLLEVGADPSIKGANNKTPLDIAKDGNYTECVKLLSHSSQTPNAIPEPTTATLSLLALAALAARRRRT